jgi:SAM-dependent methyltransferase
VSNNTEKRSTEHREVTVQSVRPHNQQAAATWGAGGRDYDKISENVSDAIEHLVRRILPVPGERFLDIATGTGWTARRLAARGAGEVGIDLGAPVIEAAKSLAPLIDFRVGDAESLEFEDESFDGVTSTFGIMFAARPEDAARELTRVCKKGGRIGLVTWQPGGSVEGFFKLMTSYMPPPSPAPPSPAPPSPLEWGRRERIHTLLGHAFDLKFETGTTTLRVPSGQAAWELFIAGFGPTKTVAAALEPQRRAEFTRDVIEYHERFRGELGVAMPREYLITVGVRR